MSNYYKTAVSERDPSEYIASHQRSMQGETKGFFELHVPNAPWGVAAKDSARVLLQVGAEGAKFRPVLRSHRTTLRGGRMEGGKLVAASAARSSQRRTYAKLKGSHKTWLTFKAWLREQTHAQ